MLKTSERASVTEQKRSQQRFKGQNVNNESIRGVKMGSKDAPLRNTESPHSEHLKLFRCKIKQTFGQSPENVKAKPKPY